MDGSPTRPLATASSQGDETPVACRWCATAGSLADPGKAGPILHLLLLGATASLPFLLLYRRLQSSDLLSNPRRREIRELVASRPGATAADVASALGFYYTTARFHLDLLSESGFLRRRLVGRYLRYYDNHGERDPEEEVVIGMGRAPENFRFLRLVATFPGIRQKEAGIRLGIAKSAVSKRVRILSTAGLLAREGPGLRLTTTGTRSLAVAAAREDGKPSSSAEG